MVAASWRVPRPSLLIPFLALASVSSCTEGAPATRESGSGAPPNILLVLADDQRADALACMPKLDQLLGSRGATFLNNFSTTPLCCPARASILTGKYAHNHGVLANGDLEEDDEARSPGAIEFRKHGNESKTIARWLKAAGYTTGYLGKYLNGYHLLLKDEPNYVPPDWDEWRAFPRAEYFDFDLIERGVGESRAVRRCYLSGEDPKGRPKAQRCERLADEVIDDGNENYSTDVLRDKAIAFIRKADASGKPWFLHFAPKAPHEPFLSPARYQPDRDEVAFTDAARSRLADCPLFDWSERPASYFEKDIDDKPDWLKSSQGHAQPDEADRLRQLQLVSVLAIEDAVEAMMQVLDELGIADDTVIVYTSDNGYAWGEHGYLRKNCAYEECIRIPLVIFDPRARAATRTVEALTLNIDLAPTLARWAGASVPEKIDGSSLVDLVEGGGAGWQREYVLTECWGPGTKGRPDVHAGVRSGRWKYVEHYDDLERSVLHRHRDGGEDVELYDLAGDPHELDNLLRLGPEALEATGHDPSEIDERAAALRTVLGRMKGE